MRILLKFIFILFSICPFVLIGQTGGIEGMVMDTKNEALPYVNILVLEKGTGTQTDDLGNFRLNLAPGPVQLVFSYLGYNNDTLSFQVNDGRVEKVTVVLQEEATLLNQVVISGSRFEKPLGKVTVSLDVIPPSLIENSNNVTLEQSIDKVPGVNVIDGQANIRGGSGYSYGAGSRVLLLLDDMPILTGDSGFPYWELIPVETIGQVEILKGASSALYGSSALNGVINVRTAYPTSEPKTKFSFFAGITQNPRNNNEIDIDTLGGAAGFRIDSTAKNWWANDTSAQKWYEKGPPNKQGLSLSHSQKFGLWDVIGGMYLYNFKSWRQYEFERRARFALKTRYRFAEKSPWEAGLGVTAQFTRTGSFFLWAGDGAEGYRPLETIGESLNRRVQVIVDPFLKYLKNNSKHELKFRFFLSNNYTDRNQDLLTNSTFGDYNYQYRFPFGGVLTTGISQNLNWVEAQLYGGRTFQAQNVAAYLQWDQEINKKLNVSTGFRYEMNRLGIQDETCDGSPNCIKDQDWEAKPVFRLGLNYQPAEYTFIRASYGQGYRFPTIAEKFVETQLGPLVIGGNDDLQSETGWSTELGIKQGVKISKWKGFIDAAVFMTQYQDMMEFTFGVLPNGFGFSSKNTGDTQIPGAEITVVGKGSFGPLSTELLMGYTKIKPTYIDFDEEADASSSADFNILKYRFEDTFKGDVQFQYNRFSFGFSGRYNSFMKAIDQVFMDFAFLELSESRGDNPNGEWVFDTRLMWDFNEHHTISFLIDNLMNNEYVVRPAMFESPRNFTLKYSLDM